MQPADIAKPDTEFAHQCALMCWCQQNVQWYPQLAFMFAVPSGGERNIAVASRLKASGVKPGVPDLFLPYPNGGFHGLFIELKRPGNESKRKGRTSDDQERFIEFLISQNFSVKICFGYLQAVDAILDYIRICGFPVSIPQT